MTLLKKILTLVDLRGGEGALVGWVLLYTFCATTTDVLVNTAAYALFLSEFDAQRIPFIYIGVSVGSVGVTTLYLRFSQRYSLAQVLLGKHLFLLLTLVAYRASLALTDARWLIFSLPMWHGVINVLLYLAFWNLVGRLFTLQQGKRLFGLFGVGQQIASLTAGLLVPLLVAGLGATNLLWVAAGASGGALCFLSVIARNAAALHTRQPVEAADPAAPEAPSQAVWRDPYIQLIFGMFALFALGSYFVDNIFYNRLASQYPSEDQLAGFLGIFNGATAGLSLLYQFYAANRLLSRYGVRAALILTPILLLCGTALFTLTGSLWGLTPLLFWLATGMYLTVQIMNDTDNTAANLLYQPLPSAARTHTQTVADGIVSPLAVGLTGVLLLVLTNLLQLDALQLAYLLLPILVIWAWVGRLLGRAYGERVQLALRQRTFQGKQDFRPDQASLAILQQTLTNPHPGAVIYALDVLAANNRAELVRCLPALLDHPNVPVRLEGLARLEQLGEASALPAIYRCWQQDHDPAVRRAALRVLATLGAAEHFDELYTYLTASDAQVRRSVMIGLLRSGELAAILAAGETLTHLVESANPAERILAAQVLGESGVASFYRPLLKMLGDAQPAVQRAALSAAGKLQHPRLWPPMVAALAWPQTRSTARATLIATGEALLPTLQPLLTAGQPNLQLRGEVLRVCGRMRSDSAIALLLPHLEYPDLQVRTLALQSLQQLGYQAEAGVRPQIERQIQAEVAQAAWLLAGLIDLAESAAELVRRALQSNLAQQRLRLWGWLALLYGAAKMQRVRDAFGLAQGSTRQLSAEQRSYLLETLDLSLPQSISKYLLPLVDELSPAEQQARLAADFPQPGFTPQQRLLAISAADPAWVTPWLRAVALYATVHMLAADDDLPGLSSAIQAAYAAPAGLLRETAAWAGARLGMQDDDDKTDEAVPTGDKIMLLTIEKVIILKTVDIFANTPDEILVEIAGLLKEIETPTGATVFAQGEPGDSMYIIVEGEVEALDGERVFTRMGERQVFGEMALLDGEPRTATIRTTQPTRLLRLDQEPFYELMDDRIEVARGVIHVLLQRLRARTHDVNRLQAQLNALKT